MRNGRSNVRKGFYRPGVSVLIGLHNISLIRIHDNGEPETEVKLDKSIVVLLCTFLNEIE